MPDTTQSNRFLHLTTPLGADALLLQSFSGTESISELFRFELKLLAENETDIAFDKLLGQGVTFGIEGEEDVDGKRNFNGIVAGMSELERDEKFTEYQAVIVPKFWTLTHKIQSRIFQQKTIPDILKKVLVGLDVTYEFQGTYEPREYVTQYHESDFAFASRLMEEEGIYYFFKHDDGSHKMVVADMPQSHPDLPGPRSTLAFEPIGGGVRTEERIFSWSKQQELRSGKYTLWDHNFELPHRHLEAEKSVADSIAVGTKTHKLKLAGNDAWEIYEYPGEYAKRFDGISKGGGAQAAELNKIFQDNTRTVKLRLEGTEIPTLLIRATGNSRFLSAGFKFTLEDHRHGNGQYTITGVYHEGNEGDFRGRTGKTARPHYQNSFAAIPFNASFPFRPPRTTPRPQIGGVQTAVVVGPAGEEIFTDKYSRVKAQFHWDREGQSDSNSSCWMRVATPWAGKNWGIIHIPRIGQEVIVEFLEGDPDRPIILGSVYNAEMMPPYDLPDNKTQSGIKSRSSKGGGPANFNEFRFEDKKGSEQVFLHAEKNQDIEVENDETHWVGNDQKITIDRDRTELVKRDEIVTVNGDRHNTIGGSHSEKVGGGLSITVGGDTQLKTAMKLATDSGTETHIKAGTTMVLEAGIQLTLKGPGGFITIDPSGVTIQGILVKINSGGAAGSGSGSSPASPKKADEQKAAAVVTSAAGVAAAQTSATAAAASAVVASVAQHAIAGVSQAAAGSVAAMSQMGQMAQGVGDQILGEINSAVNQAQGLVNQAIDQATSELKDAVDELTDAADKLADEAKAAEAELEEQANQAVNQAQKQVADMQKQAADMAGQAQQQLQGAAAQVQGAAQQAMSQAAAAAAQAQQQCQAAASQAQQAAQNAAQQVQQQAAQMASQAQQAAQNAAAQAQNAATQAGQQAQALAQQGQAAAAQAASQAQQAAGQAQQQLQQATAQAAQAADKAAAAAQEEVKEVEKEASQAAAQAQQEVKQAEQQVQQAAANVEKQAQQSAAQVQQAAAQAQQQVTQAANQATQQAAQAQQMTQQAAQQVTHDVQQAASQAQSSVSNTASQAMGQVGQQASQAGKSVANAMKGLGL